MTRRPLLVVFAKRPEPGKVKTRLCPPFTPEQAADFYRCLLQDVLEAMASVAPPLGLELRLALHPPEAVDEPDVPIPASFGRVAQRGVDLSSRIAHSIDRASAEGYSPILIRGSDSPALDGGTLAAALRALEEADLVLCPDLDGGYNLVGVRGPAPGLFDHEMSTGHVLRDTLARAGGLGLRSSLLPAGFDIDTVDDLRTFRHSPQAMRICSRTVRYLDREKLWPPEHGPANER